MKNTKQNAKTSIHILSASNLPFSAKSKPCGFRSIKVVQSRVKISKREMRNSQEMATHHVTWKWWSKEEKFHEKPITFFKLISLYSHMQWFSFGRENIKETEGRQEHKTFEDKNYSVQYLAWRNLNPNANCKHPCFVEGDSQGAQETEFTLQTNAARWNNGV